MFPFMPIHHFQVKSSKQASGSTLIPKKGLLGHDYKDHLSLSALLVWALCKLLQTCWMEWCPRCWFPPGVTPRHPQSRGILECVNWSYRPAAALLPLGMVLEKKKDEIFYDWAWLRTEMKCKSNIKDGSSRVSRMFLHLSTLFLCPTKQKHFPSQNPVRQILSLLMHWEAALQLTAMAAED